MREPLIFWFDQPPKVGKGAFNEVSKVWSNKVYYICDHDYNLNRKKANWDDGEYGNASVIMLNEKLDKQSFIIQFLNENSDAIHILNGFSSDVSKLLIAHFKLGMKLLLMMERPNNFGLSAIRFLRKMEHQIRYRYYNVRYRRYTSGIFVLGQNAVSEYKSYGWPKDILFPFMYSPQMTCIDNAEQLHMTQETTKFLYVGRFMYSTKGLDVLLDAAERLNGNWILDLVGGYGKNRNDVLQRISKNRRIRFLGIWDANSVISKIRSYDVVVVPSRYDGWNLLVNQAIMAGVGVITTDQATSDELVRESGAGLVVKAGSRNELHFAMQKAINSSDCITQWKEAAEKYRQRIEPLTVAEYMIECIDYALCKNKEIKPHQPWIVS